MCLVHLVGSSQVGMSGSGSRGNTALNQWDHASKLTEIQNSWE